MNGKQYKKNKNNKNTINMEKTEEKLEKILNDFQAMKEHSKEDIEKFKQQEFDLFSEISTIKELCTYFLVDMTIDGVPKPFIDGMYSGTINGSMFVINQVQNILNSATPEHNAEDTITEIQNKLDEIKGIQ